MKYLFLIIIFGLLSCHQKADKERANESTDRDNSNDAAFENAVEEEKLRQQSFIKPFSGTIAKSDLPKIYFITDTLHFTKKDSKSWLIYNEIVGVSTEYLTEFPTIFPANRNGKLMGTYQFSPSILIIPFHLDPERESTIFTKWNVTAHDSLSYLGYLKQPLGTKYAFSYFIDKVVHQKKEYLIGKTTGGEGGDYFQSIWYAEYNGEDDYSIIDYYETGHSSEDPIEPTLKHIVSNDKLIILLQKDSVFYKADTTIKIFIDETRVKTFKLNG